MHHPPNICLTVALALPRCAWSIDPTSSMIPLSSAQHERPLVDDSKSLGGEGLTNAKDGG